MMRSTCRMFRFLFVAAVLTGTSVSATETALPLVEEHYDEVWVVQECLPDRDWVRTRAYFVRGKKVIAERSVDEQMQWAAAGDGRFTLTWDDYGVCRRIVSFDSLVQCSIDEPAGALQDTNPWWWMGRRMTDLKAPGN